VLDYIYGVPRITDSNRLREGIWRERARQVELSLARAIPCAPHEVANHLDIFMRELYTPGVQRMNPVGIAFASAVVHLIQKFSSQTYQWTIEAKIGVDVFPNLKGFRRQSVDIVAARQGAPFAVISSKWGIRHDRIRDPQEEADTYKREIPSLKFFIVTNEFDNARLQKILTYPTIDGVFHIRRDLVWQVYSGHTQSLSNLKDFTELLPHFS